jgi:16S rRNA (adenine1518-N6/adenine1519-N6)-dimethyltransferase
VPKRFLGQHFLSDPRILARIADQLEAEPGDRVLEIGPGRGALTEALVARGVRLTAIERDRDLVPGLRTRFPGVTVIEGDALTIDWAAAVGAQPGDPWLVTGNIPYYITTPLIEKALASPRPDRIVFLIQREVALRLAAKPGTKEYGALTVGVQAAARVERAFTVAAGSFHPRPRVDSAVVRLIPLDEPIVPAAEAPAFRRFVTGLFSARRKQLGRALQSAFDLDAETVGTMLRALGIDPARRAEVLELAEFVRIYRWLVDAGRGSALLL